MAFDIEGARRAGYSDAEIADHLAKQRGFKIAEARKSGYTDTEIVGYLSKADAKPQKGLIDRAREVAGNVVDTVDRAMQPVREAIGYDANAERQNRERTIANIRAEQQADVAKQDGFLDRVGDLWTRGDIAASAGVNRVASGLARTPEERDSYVRAARREEAIGNTPIAGEATWDDVKKDWTYLPRFVGEQGIASLPSMVQNFAGTPGIILNTASNVGSIAQSRAEADGRQDATGTDVGIAAPFGIASSALDVAGLDSMVKGIGGGVIKSILKDAAVEGATEGAQGAIEYAGGALGTNKGFSFREAGEQALQSAVVGAGVGGAFGGMTEGGKEAFDAAGRIRARRVDDARAPALGDREAAVAEAATVTPEDEASPLPTQDIVEGRVAMAEATGAKVADSNLSARGAPAVGTSVTVSNLPGGRSFAGTITDHFTGENGDAGVVITPSDGGKPMREYFDTLDELGVSVTPFDPTAEADALDAQIAAAAAQGPDLSGTAPGAPASQQRSPARRPEAGGVNQAIVEGLKARGFSEAHALGIAAGIHAESASRTGARNPTSGAMGIGQWLGSRKDALRQRYGDNPTLDQQLDYLAYELRGGDAGGKHVLAQNDPAKVLDAYVRKFMRPKAGAETDGDLARGMAALGLPMDTTAPASAAMEPVPAERAPSEAMAPTAAPAPIVAPREVVQAGGDMAGEQIDKEWTSFAPGSGTIGIPRAEMPQIKAEHRGAMVNFLNARGIAHEEETIAASDLKPSQAEFSPAKVEKAKSYQGGNRAILISADNYVVDGHHQWLAARDDGVGVRAIRLDAPIRDVIQAAHDFPSSQTADGATAPARPQDAASQPVSNPDELPAPAALQVESSATVEDTPTGKSIAVTGASAAELEAIAAAVPKAMGVPRKDGAVVYSKKYADKIRAALAGVKPHAAPQAKAAPATSKVKPGIGDARMADYAGQDVNGWDGDPNDERGMTGSSKARFLTDAKKYLQSVEKVLADEGFSPDVDKKGKPLKAVQVNEGGPAVSGEVYYRARRADGSGVNVEISAGSMRGKAGYTIRVESVSPDGKRGQNNWIEGGLTAQELAGKLRDIADTVKPKADEPATGSTSTQASTAPEHAAVGVDDRELSEIVSEFNDAQASMGDSREQITHVFDAPAKNEIVRLADKVRVYHAEHGWMTPEEAKAKIARWKEHARAQGGAGSKNADKVVLSLFDLSGEWSRPWEEAGYQVYRFDIQADPEVGDVFNFSTDFFGDWFGDFDGQDIYAILAACPCTDFASSGARHFAAKDADGRTVASVKLVHQTLATIEYFKPAVWAIENPVGRIEKLGGLPPWRLAFDPNHLGETYTKKTLIWGRFNGDLPIAPVDPVEGSKMHTQYGGKSLATKNARSVTPEGFSYAFFMANNAVDHPAMAIANKFDRLDRDLIGKAVKAGVTGEQIDEAVADFYYQELDDEAANGAIRDLIEQQRQRKMGAKPQPVQASKPAETPSALEDAVLALSGEDYVRYVTELDPPRPTNPNAITSRAAQIQHQFNTKGEAAMRAALAKVAGKPVDRSAAIIMDPAAGTVKTVPLGGAAAAPARDERNAAYQRGYDASRNGVRKADGGAKEDAGVRADFFAGWSDHAQSKPSKLERRPRDDSSILVRKGERYRVAKSIPGEYVSEGETYDIGSASPDSGQFIAPDGSGTFIRAFTLRRALRDGSLVKVGDSVVESTTGSTAPANPYAEPAIIKQLRDLGVDTAQVERAKTELAGGDATLARDLKRITIDGLRSEYADLISKGAGPDDTRLAKVAERLRAVGESVSSVPQYADSVQTALGSRADDTYTAADLGGMTKALAESVAQTDNNPKAQETILDAIDRGLIRDGDMLAMGNPRWAIERGFADIGPVDGTRQGRITEAGKRKLAELRGEPTPPSKNRLVTDERAAELRDRLKAKLNPGRLNSGIDPEILAIGAELAVYHIEKGARRFAAFARAIASDLDIGLPAIRTYLRGWYNGARDMMEDMGESVAGMDDADEVGRSMRTFDQWANEAPVTESQNAATGTVDAQLPNRVPASDAGPGARDVQGTSQVGSDGRAPGEEGSRGAGDVPATDRGRADAPERGTARSADGARSDRAGVRDTDNLPAAGRDAGSARKAAAAVKGTDWVIEPGSLGEERSLAQKARDNVDAIALVKQIEREGRAATREEQATIARYIGWGGLKNVFPDPQTGAYGKGFEELGPRLRALLTDEEYETAQRSIQYAHYTSEKVVRPMWDIARQLGFKGGMVFEPGMGTGNFRGMMPADIAAASSYAGLEYDHLTASIAKLLYPQSGVQQADYTRTPGIKGAFDLVIGNPPFSETAIASDPDYAKHRFLLHDFFFAKSLDALKPGGLLMFITSAGTMNKVNDKARQYLADRADLVGAIRLPGNAFEQNAGTSVTTDIVILRKRLPGEKPGDQAWTGVEAMTLPDRTGAMVQGNVNRYFVQNPAMVLGEQGMFDTLVAGVRYAVRAPKGFDLEQGIRTAAEALPGTILDATPRALAPGFIAPDVDLGSGERKDGSYYVDPDGRLMQYRGGAGRPVQAPGKGVTGGMSAAAQQRVRGLVPVKEALRAVYAADLKADDVGGAAAREKLNKAYDAFVKQFGPINKTDISYRRPSRVELEGLRAEAREEARLAGAEWEDGSFDLQSYLDAGAKLTEIAKAREEARAAALAAGRRWEEGTFDADDVPDKVIEKRPNLDPFMEDDEAYRLAAIEHYNKDTGEAAKGRAFFENAITLEGKPTINSANDALLYSLNRLGRPDLRMMAQMAGKSEQAIIEELGDRLFEVPGKPGVYETGEMYLSGNVREKLAVAQKEAAKNPAIQRNVRALEAALPAPLTPSEIAANLGMPWLPTSVVERFVTEKMGLQTAKIGYLGKLAQWTATGDTYSAAARTTWGTERMDAMKILEAALNRQTPVIRDKIDTAQGEKTVINDVATQAVQDKMAEMKAAFREWVWTDPKRSGELVDLYNREYNSLVAPKFDGSYLTTPGIASGWSWRPHQRAVIARIIQSGNTYMAHEVGAGKTSAMIGSGMEMKRLGLVNKPMYVVPNHMLGQFTKEFYEQYPLARILVADEQRFHTSRRKEFIARMSAEDWDAVIITHSAFGFIPMSDDFTAGMIQEQIDDLVELLSEIDKGERVTRRKVEQQKEALSQRLSGLLNRKRDQVFTFEETGVDFLFVDEAHLFRKLDFATKMGNVKGIDPSGSQMSFDLYAKTRFLEQRRPGRNLALASGTPITNTMAELFSVSRYLQQGELEKRGLGHFDAWAGAFGDTVTALEQDAAGGYKPVTRFAQFVNVPELSVMVRQVMDVVGATELRQYVSLPNLKGGNRQLVSVEMTPNQERYKATLQARMEAIKARSGPPQKGDDILLSVIGDGRKAAIDYRLIDASAPREEGSKLERLIEEVARRHKAFTRTAFYKPLPAGAGFTEKAEFHGPAAQMVFSDFGINGDFPVHKYIKSALIERGIPANQIALIQDFKTHIAKQRLFNDINEGKIRVLIGSVAKMGTGVNAQKRLRALHNMDAQWFPANDTQRNGRIIRQGNMNPEIEILDYATNGTYDSTMWGLMAKKARFIEGFMRGDPTMRDMEDLGEASQYEQAAAMTTSDPRIMDLTEWKQELEKTERRMFAHEREQQNIRSRLASARSDIAEADRLAPLVEQDIAKRTIPEGDEFTATLKGETFDDRGEFGAALLAAMDDLTERANGKERREGIGEFGGFPLVASVFPIGRNESSQSFYIKRAGDRETRVDMGADSRGLVTRLTNALRGFDKELSYFRSMKETAQARIADFEPKLGATFDDGGKSAELRGKIKALESILSAESDAAEQARKATAQQAAEAAPPKQSIPEQEPVARLTGKELGAWTDMLDLLKKARAWYRTKLRLTTVTASDGAQVGFTRAGEGKIRAGDRIARAIPAIPAIIEQGKHEGPFPPSEKWAARGVTAAHRYIAPVEIAGEVIRFGVLVQEMRDGRRFYMLSDKPDALGVGGQPSLVEGALQPNPKEITPDVFNLEIMGVPDKPSTSSDVAGIREALQQQFETLRLADKVKVRVVESLGGAAGIYAHGIVTIATDTAQGAAFTMHHEAVHALREMGLFKPEEWAILSAAVRRDTGLMRSIRQRYAKLSEEAQLEEAIADLFARYQDGRYAAAGTVERVFKMLRQFFEAVRNAFAGRGLRTAEGVMQSAARGEVGARSGQASLDGSERASFASQTDTPAFKRWFGNSKVTDEKGAPLVVYRGMTRPIEDDRFRPTDGGTYGEGIYLSSDRSVADFWADPAETGDAGHVYPVYASIQKPADEAAASAAEAKATATRGSSIEILRGQGYDGIVTGDGEIVAFDASQVKSAVHNSGAFDPADGRISFSIPERDDMVEAAREAGTGGAWKEKVSDAADAWRTAVQDRYLPLLKVQRQIEQQTGEALPPSRNPYLGEELMTGRIGSRLERLAEDHVEPLFEALHAAGVSVDELESFLYARHAPERNARIAEINPDFVEGEGSGMTDLEAAAIMSRIRRAGKAETMERLAARVDAIRDLSLRYRVESGLMSQAQADEWKATYQFYVPLRGFKETGGDPLPERMNRSGGGINVRGRESKAAFGRRSKADSPLAYTIMQAEEAIVRGETNRVAQRFIELARANPDPEFWKVNKVTQRQRMNEDSGLVESYLTHNLLAEDKDWTVSAKFNGKEVRVTMNKQNTAARRLADAMRNLTQHQLDWVTIHLGKVNRFLSAVNTSFNPEFVITNAFRDVQTAALNLTGVGVDGIVRGTMKDYRAALAASTKGAFGKHSGEWGRWYDEFVSNGGRIYFNKVENIEEIKGRIEKAAKTATMRAGEGGVLLQGKRVLLAVRDTIENVNLGVENAVRLSAYKNAREAGLSPDQAASLAKNLTVNFNRRGTLGPAINSAYLFANASIQGTARIFMAMRSPKVRKMLAGVMIAAAMTEILNAMVTGDDDDGESFYDKIPAYEKSRNLIVMLPGGKSYLKLPMPYGYNVFWSAGRSAAEVARRGGDRAMESAANFVGDIADAFNPIGGTSSLLNFFSPTILDPIVDLEQNKDFSGRKIMPDQPAYGAAEPDSQRYWGSGPAIWRPVTDFLNAASGGDDVLPGAIDVSPETLEYLSGVVVGSAGAFTQRVGSLIAKGFDEDEEITANDIPMARKVIGGKPGWHDKAAYYDRVKAAEQELSYVKGYVDGDKIDEARAYAGEKRSYLMLEPAVKAAKRDMRDVRKARREIETAHERGRIDDERYRAMKQRVKEAETRVVTGFNTRWNEAMKEGR